MYQYCTVGKCTTYPLFQAKFVKWTFLQSVNQHFTVAMTITDSAVGAVRHTGHNMTEIMLIMKEMAQWFPNAFVSHTQGPVR